MRKVLPVMAKLNILFLGFVALFLLALTALGQSSPSLLVSPSHPFVDNNGNGIDDFEEHTGTYSDPNKVAEVYGVTFPVAELGGCTDFASCHTFCEDPLNDAACKTFATEKGFYQDEPLQTQIDVILTSATGELGCNSQVACHSFCEIPANYDTCNSFAGKHKTGGGYVVDPTSPQIVQQAQRVLGCSSASDCLSFCDRSENAASCTQFRGQAGLRGGEHPVGPGGCTSQGTCTALCSDPANFQVCSGFHSTSGGTFAGPGGCKDEASCRSYCQQNESECRSLGGPGPGGQPGGGYNPAEMCNRTPNCAWQTSANTCQCGFYGETRESQQRGQEYQNFCQANPDKCQPGQPGGFENDQQRQEFGRFCREHPEQCRREGGPYPTGTYGGPGGGHDDPAVACGRYGCTWTGSTCQCTAPPPGPYPTGGGPYPTGGGPYPTYTPPSSYEGPHPTYTPGGPYPTYSPGGPYPTYTPPSSYTGPQPTGGYTPPSSYTGPTHTPPSSYTSPPSSYTQTPPSSYTQPPPPPPPSSYSPPPPPSSPPPSSYESSPPSSYSPPPPPSSYESHPPPPPGETHGAQTSRDLLRTIIEFLFGR